MLLLIIGVIGLLIGLSLGIWTGKKILQFINLSSWTKFEKILVWTYFGSLGSIIGGLVAFFITTLCLAEPLLGRDALSGIIAALLVLFALTGTVGFLSKILHRP